MTYLESLAPPPKPPELTELPQDLQPPVPVMKRIVKTLSFRIYIFQGPVFFVFSKCKFSIRYNTDLRPSLWQAGHWRLRRRADIWWMGHQCSPGGTCRWRYCPSGHRTCITKTLTFWLWQSKSQLACLSVCNFSSKLLNALNFHLSKNLNQAVIIAIGIWSYFVLLTQVFFTLLQHHRDWGSRGTGPGQWWTLRGEPRGSLQQDKVITVFLRLFQNPKRLCFRSDFSFRPNTNLEYKEVYWCLLCCAGDRGLVSYWCELWPVMIAL